MDGIFENIYQHYKGRLDKVGYISYQNSSEESAEEDEKDLDENREMTKKHIKLL